MCWNRPHYACYPVEDRSISRAHSFLCSLRSPVRLPCQALTAQPILTFQQAGDAMVRVDTGLRLHLMEIESASVASNTDYWRCDVRGHLAPNCPLLAPSRTSLSSETLLITEYTQPSLQEPEPLILLDYGHCPATSSAPDTSLLNRPV